VVVYRIYEYFEYFARVRDRPRCPGVSPTTNSCACTAVCGLGHGPYVIDIGLTCAIFVFERIVKPFFGLGETSESEIARGTVLFNRFGGVLTGELEKHRFVAGETLSLADLAIGSSLCVSDRANYPLEEFRAIQRWHTELQALPAWKRTCALQGG
jgi:hypothetical protein